MFDEDYFQILRDHGLIVEDAVVVMHRQQGAEKKLDPAGLNLHR